MTERQIIRQENITSKRRESVLFFEFAQVLCSPRNEQIHLTFPALFEESVLSEKKISVHNYR